MSGAYNDALTAWANEHQVSAATAMEELFISLPGTLFNLAGTGDRRAIPLLERALLTNNYSLQLAAAVGLALYDDPAATPVLIATCKKAPSETANMMAYYLAWSSDPEAQRVAGMFASKETMDSIHQMKAQGKTFAGSDSTLPSAQQNPRPRTLNITCR